METSKETEKITDPSSCLRLLVPPLQLLSASMWSLAQQKDVLSYQKLQEFVSMVTEAVPGLMTHRQRAQLVLGLRARFILELCKESAPLSLDCQVIQSHLDRLPLTTASTEYKDAEVTTTESTFISLVQSLLKDPIERAYFFQEVFPVAYGPQYDAALHVLLSELLLKLEKLLPVPDLKQTVTWLASAPSVLEESVQTSTEELNSVFQHYKTTGLLKMTYTPSSTAGGCIMSALTVPPSQKPNVSLHSLATLLHPAEQYSVVAVYAQVEGGEEETTGVAVQVQTGFYEEEIEAAEDTATVVTSRVEDPGDVVDVAKALETLTKTFALRKEQLGPDAMPQNSGNATVNVSNETNMNIDQETSAQEGGNMDDSSSKDQSRSFLIQEEARLPTEESQIQESESSDAMQIKPCWQETSKKTGESGQEAKISSTEVSVSPSVVAIKGSEKGNIEETSIIFTCALCPFHRSEVDSPPHFHMQSVPTQVYRTLSGTTFTPSPSASDQIFTSIKLFPNGSMEQSKGEEEQEKGEEKQGKGKEEQSAVPQHRGERKALSCETCGKTFTRTSDVRRHQLTHTGERPFHCSHCQATFQHSWDLAKHQSKHHGAATTFSCLLCHSSFANLRALTMHHKKSHAHESRLPQICSICSRSFSSTAELLEHRRTHVAARRYVCQRCGEAFDSLLARSQHRQTHQTQQQFKCPQCDKTYTRRSDVKRHLSTHSGERPYQCNQCGRCFSLRFMLAKHMRVHTGERPHQCSHCAKRFTLASVLARHERMHTGEKPFLCSQCGKGFLSQGELLKHHRSHVDDKPFSCPQCHKRFKSKKTQQEHMVSHSGARPYPCSYCGKCFTKPYALTRHHLIHTGERPFPCGHCDKSFLTPSEAQLHRRVHTGERPYACQQCTRKFKSSSELARHRRRHAGLKRTKPHCELCMATFTSKVNLKKHMETHQVGGVAADTCQ